MNILFDHQTFSNLTYGGIPRYYAQLIAGINKTPGNEAYLPLFASNNVHLHEIGLHARPFFPQKRFPKKLQLLYYLNKIHTIHKLYQHSYDVFHATYYDPYFLPHLKGRPFVVTFLDMIHEKFGSRFSELAYDGVITKQKRLLANRADRIIAISESTKRDVVELLDIDPSKIEVIYLGNSLVSNYTKSPLVPNETPYLLFVGNRSMYKNFEGLLTAIYLLLKKYKIKLICAGGGAFTKPEEVFIHSLGAAKSVEQRHIDDQTLPLLYQNALAFVFPTLYEGFGIPILEAFACGCPCIVSDVSSLPEVADEAALYMNPTVPESMTHAVELMINDSGLREEMVRRGYERLAQFSWERTVAKTISLYQSLT